jgi:hypothetical protein
MIAKPIIRSFVLCMASCAFLLTSHARAADSTSCEIVLRNITEHMLLTREQWLDLMKILGRVNEIASPQGFIFTGSRTHKLWRSGFDIDISVLGAKADFSQEIEPLKTNFFVRHGIRVDFLNAFGNQRVETLLRRGTLISPESERNLVETSVAIWNRIATKNERQCQLGNEFRDGKIGSARLSGEILI